MLRHRLDNGTCSLLPQAGTLAGNTLSKVIALARSQNVVEASVGLATINALADQRAYHSSQEDITDLLHIRRSERVGIVGHIEPIVQKIKQRSNECFVFDEAKSGMNGIRDVSQEVDILPRCDVVILSATSLLNNTFDSLLEMSSHAREICIMGPSTPLLPEFFQERGVTLLAGRQIIDADKILQIISEAGGTKRFGGVTKKINLILKNALNLNSS
jgi:hypothetical protein